MLVSSYEVQRLLAASNDSHLRYWIVEMGFPKPVVEPGPLSAGPPLVLAGRGPVGVQERSGGRRRLARRPLAHPGAPRAREAGTWRCRARGSERGHGTASQAPPSSSGKRPRQHPKSTWLGRLQSFSFPLAAFGHLRSRGASPRCHHSCHDGPLAWPSGEIGAPRGLIDQQPERRRAREHY